MYAKITIILCLSLFSLHLPGQKKIKITTLDQKHIPPSCPYQGTVQKALTWVDSNGKNMVLTCATGNFSNDTSSMDGQDAELYAYHYVIQNNKTNLMWKIFDYVRDCPVDIEASFILNAIQITDLNADNLAEIWIMYKTACRGDVSPADMKIIMYEGKNKYAMRGQNRVKLDDKTFLGGQFKFDNMFNKAPVSFKTYAKKMWADNIEQKWE